jgi:hypothetical protein
MIANVAWKSLEWAIGGMYIADADSETVLLLGTDSSKKQLFAGLHQPALVSSRSSRSRTSWRNVSGPPIVYRTSVALLTSTPGNDQVTLNVAESQAHRGMRS